MEAAASIAGLLSLVGQSIDGLVKLRRFFLFAKDAPEKVKELISDIRALRDTLEQTQRVLKGLDDEYLYPSHLHGSLLVELRASVTLCERDVSEWDKNACDVNTGSWSGVKAFFRKVKLAADRDWFEDLKEKIAGHQRRVSLSLSVLGMTMDHLGLTKLNELSTNIRDLKDAQEKLTDAVTDSASGSREDIRLTRVEAHETHEVVKTTHESVQGTRQEVRETHDEVQETHEDIRSIARSISSIETALTRLTGGSTRSHAPLGNAVSYPGHEIFANTPDDIKRHLSQKGRTGPLTTEQRHNDALMRKFGACSDCRRRRVACNPRHHGMTWDDVCNKLSSALHDQSEDVTGIETEDDTGKLLGWPRLYTDIDREWTCDTISGIDAAFMDERCIFCNDSFRDIDPFRRGRHLVDKHRFGQCHDDVTYTREDLPIFQDHLEHFHQCSGHSTRDSLVQPFSRARGLTFRPVSPRRDLQTPVNSANTVHAVPWQEESPQTSLVLQARLDQVIDRAKSASKAASRSSRVLGREKGVLRSLDHAGFSLSRDRPDEILMCYEAAGIEEELVVCGHDDLIYRRAWPPDRSVLVKYLRAQQRQKHPSEGLTETHSSHLSIHPKPDPPKDEGSDDNGLSILLSTRAGESDHQHATQILRRSKSPTWSVDDSETSSLSLEHPPLWVTTRLICQNAKGTILCWLRAFFVQSHSLRTLLRIHTAPTWPPGTTAEDWTRSFLEACDRVSIEGSIDEEVAAGSDGAVDSRDNLSHQVSLLPAPDGERRDHTGIEIVTKDLSRKRLHDRSAEQGVSKRVRRGR